MSDVSLWAFLLDPEERGGSSGAGSVSLQTPEKERPGEGPDLVLSLDFPLEGFLGFETGVVVVSVLGVAWESTYSSLTAVSRSTAIMGVSSSTNARVALLELRVSDGSC